MSFLEPLFLLGLVGAALPVLIHLIHRRKATKRTFPALSLLAESSKRSARALKVRQWLLMALRILAIVLLAIAIAKPFVLSDSGVSADDRLPTALVVVLDDSASMHFEGRWERAQSELAAIASSLRPWDEAGLVTTTSSSLSPRLSEDHDALDEAAETLEPTPFEGDLRAAVRAAIDLLATSQLPNRRVIVITDASTSALDLSSPLESGVRAEIVPRLVTSTDDPPPLNLGITDVRYAQDPSSPGTWLIDSTIRNFSDSESEPTEIKLDVGATSATASLEPIAAQEEVVHTFRHTESTPGSFAATLSLDAEDAYPLDDVRHFVFRTRSKLSVLLVNGEAASIAYDDEMFFLSRALNPDQRTDTGIITTVISPEGLDGRDLATFDALVLSNVPRISAATASRLERYVREGGGILFTAGDQIDPTSYNQTLGALLPKPLRGIKALAERDDPDAPVKITRFGATHHTHPIFRAFSLPGGTPFRAQRSSRIFCSNPPRPINQRPCSPTRMTPPLFWSDRSERGESSCSRHRSISSGQTCRFEAPISP